MNIPELESLLAQLRRFRTDHQLVEAKRARHGLPDDLWKTLSAFANVEGGLLVLGVDEKNGFAVTGLADPGQITSDLQALASQMEPPLRLAIELIEHPDGIVLTAAVPAVLRDQRPCHLRREGPYQGSCVRVGDGDYRLGEPEVAELLAAQRREDQSARPAPDGAELDPKLVGRFCEIVRSSSRRHSDATDTAILRGWGAIRGDEEPTIAGILSLGKGPEAHTMAARMSYRRLPNASSPAGARFAGRQLEGTIGEILDDALLVLRKDLDVFQIPTDRGLVDDTDVPLEALREIVSNALLHRSLTPAMETNPGLIEVSDQAVIVSSPGGLFAAVDPERIGLGQFSGVRNLSLVRICEKIPTPSGQRIIESQASGIPAADRVTRLRGVAPPLFIDRASSLEVMFLRGRLPEDTAREALVLKGVEPNALRLRLLAWAYRYEALRGEVDPAHLHAGRLDLHFGARLCAPEPLERVAAELFELQGAGLLSRTGGAIQSSWILAELPAEEVSVAAEAPDLPKARRKSRKQGPVPDVLNVVSSSGGAASREEISAEFGVTPRTVIKWINRAVELGLLEATTESVFDMRRRYRLTAKGKAMLEHPRGV